MPDITMCTNTECPNATHCYRVLATPDHWQSFSKFNYLVTSTGVECDGYIAVKRDDTRIKSKHLKKENSNEQ